MKVARISLLIMFFFLCCSFSFAQCIVRGKVLKQGTSGEYVLSGVPVTLSREDQSFRSPTVYTEQNGVFRIKNITSGKYVLEIWLYGFKEAPKKFEVIIDKNYRKKFYDIKPIVLP